MSTKTARARAGAQVGRMRLILHVSSGPTSHRSYELDDGDLPVTLGRSADCTVVLPFRGVSRHHCRLEASDGPGPPGLRVRDTASKAGTTVNGQLVAPGCPMVVRSGDVLRIGPVVVRVDMVGSIRTASLLVEEGSGSADETGAIAVVQVRARCEMCGGPVSAADILEGGRMLADERALCAACVGQLPTAPTFGPLVFLQTVGRGGSGCVYKALHWIQQTVVAVKQVAIDRSRHSPDDIARLLGEIAVGRRFRHPSIPTVHEASTDGESFYVTLDYIEGQDLNDLIRTRGPLGPREAARLAREIGSALEYAHELGVIHRDVKPKNILIDRRGHAYLTDFGLSKSGDASRLRCTRHGEGLGTPHFMAPEQFRDAVHATFAMDVYSLAATLYFAVTGRAPFDEVRGIKAVFEAVTRRRPLAVDQVRPGLPHAVSAALAAGLAIDPEERPRRIRQLVDAFALPLEMMPRGDCGAPAAARPTAVDVAAETRDVVV